KGAHAVDRAAAPDGEIRHVEGFIRVVRILPAERQQVAQRDVKVLLGVLPMKALDEGRGEAVEARRDRGVGGEDVSRTGDRQRHVERVPCVPHVAPGWSGGGRGRWRGAGPPGGRGRRSPGGGIPVDTTRRRRSLAPRDRWRL